MAIPEFVLSLAAKKAAKKLVQLGVAYMAAQGLDSYVASMGISIDPAQLTLWLTGITFTVLEIVRSFLKRKVGIKFL